MLESNQVFPEMSKLRQIVTMVSGGTVAFCGISIYQGNERFYQDVIMPSLRLFDAETVHRWGITVARYNLFPKPKLTDSPVLSTMLFGRRFPNPVGLAAGFDKHGEAVDGLLSLGFGFVEIGSITPLPQEGNPRPRVFRLVEDRAVINRYGFNSEGHQVVFDRLKARHSGKDSSEIDRAAGILGINLGKNKTSPDAVGDYVKGVTLFGEMADYLVINISSPNTPGLRDMQGRKQLEELLDKVVEARDSLQTSQKPPLLVKIAPDLTDKDKADIAAVVCKKQSGVDGLIISNTTSSRPDLLKSPSKAETGGLSGEPLRDLATKTISDMYKLTQGQMPIIGVGGVSSGQHAYDKIKAGASLIQLYSGLVYQGPPVVTRVRRELDQLVRDDGYDSVSQVVGANHKMDSR